MWKRSALVCAFLCFIAFPLAAQDTTTEAELTLVTGNDGTADTLTLTLTGVDSAGQPIEIAQTLDQPDDLQPDATDTYTFTVSAAFCDLTGFELTLSGQDVWTPESIRLTLNGVTVFNDEEASVFAPVTADSYPPNGRWQRTAAYLSECQPELLPPAIPSVSAQNVIVTPPVLATDTLAPTLSTEPITCPGFLPSRLVVGEPGHVTPGAPNNLRDTPGLSGNIIGRIPGGAIFEVLEGPECDPAGIAWWRVEYEGQVGWTAEGAGNEYFTVPGT